MMEAKWISVITALVTTFLTFYVVVKTMPQERPLVALFDNKAKGELSGETLKIALMLFFKNVGKHPAEKVTLQIVRGIKDDPTSFKKVTNQTIANTIASEGVLNWTEKMGIEVKNRTLKGDLLIPKLEAIIFMRIKYEDGYGFFGYHRSFKDDIWITYTLGMQGAAHATIQDAKANLPFVLKSLE